MKTRFAISAAVTALFSLSSVSQGTAGETFKTSRGKEYKDCEIVGKDPYGVTFRHAGGMAKLAYADLPAEAQKRFGYDRVEAKRFVAAHQPKRAPVAVRSAAVSDRVSAKALNSYPQRRSRSRGRSIRNPYSLAGSLHNPAAYGASFGGFVQPYFAGAFGAPSLVTAIPNGFFTPNTLRIGARPLIDSPVAPALGSYSQIRDARASAVRAAVRSTSRPSVRVRP